MKISRLDGFAGARVSVGLVPSGSALAALIEDLEQTGLGGNAM